MAEELHLDRNSFVGTIGTEFGNLTNLGKPLVASPSVDAPRTLEFTLTWLLQLYYPLQTIKSLAQCQQSFLV